MDNSSQTVTINMTRTLIGRQEFPVTELEIAAGISLTEAGSIDNLFRIASTKKRETVRGGWHTMLNKLREGEEVIETEIELETPLLDNDCHG